MKDSFAWGAQRLPSYPQSSDLKDNVAPSLDELREDAFLTPRAWLRRVRCFEKTRWVKARGSENRKGQNYEIGPYEARKMIELLYRKIKIVREL